MIRITIALFGAALTIGACSSPKQVPAWPEGSPRPINAAIINKVQQ
jgi:hypothetical protein